MPSNLSTRQSLLLTAFASAIATTTVILSFQNLRREHRTEKLKKEVGEDVEEWERSREGSGFTSPEDRAEWHANGVTTPGGGSRRREWAKGEYDEGLIREQVCVSHAIPSFFESKTYVDSIQEADLLVAHAQL